MRNAEDSIPYVAKVYFPLMNSSTVTPKKSAIFMTISRSGSDSPHSYLLTEVCEICKASATERWVSLFFFLKILSMVSIVFTSKILYNIQKDKNTGSFLQANLQNLTVLGSFLTKFYNISNFFCRFCCKV